MPADVLFLIALVAVALVNVCAWRAAKLWAEFSVPSHIRAARYGLLATLCSAAVLAIVAVSLNWGTL
jgi:hypothetical protein